VLFARPRSKIEVLNDLDGELVNFFRCAQTVPEAVARAVAALPHSRKLYGLLKQCEPDLLDPIQRAARFVYLVHRSFGGLPNKGFAFCRQGNAARSANSIVQSVAACAARLDRVILECLDWRAVLEKYDAQATLFYLDPPYLGTDAGYKHDLTEQDHRDLAHALKSLRGKWLLTIGDSPLMRKLYYGYPVLRISTAQSLKKDLRGRFRQIIIRNY